MRRAAKVDANQQELVSALRKAGLSVAITSTVGHGFPDILVGLPDPRVASLWGGANVLLEIKTEAGKLTAHQEVFHRTWQGPLLVVRSVDEAFLGLERWR